MSCHIYASEILRSLRIELSKIKSDFCKTVIYGSSLFAIGAFCCSLISICYACWYTSLRHVIPLCQMSSFVSLLMIKIVKN